MTNLEKVALVLNFKKQNQMSEVAHVDSQIFDRVADTFHYTYFSNYLFKVNLGTEKLIPMLKIRG